MTPRRRNRPQLVYCDERDRIYEHPSLEPAFRSGTRFVPVDPAELIELPFGSHILSLPGRRPVARRKRTDAFECIPDDDAGVPIVAAASFLSSGFLRTFLPGYTVTADAPTLPLWAYAGVAIVDGEYAVPAMRIDEDPRSDPELHLDDAALTRAQRSLAQRLPDNRLVRQLAHCSTEYRCLCARNFFLGRFEAPVPTTPACNAACVGCLSLQEDSGFCHSQDRLDFSPTPEEIAEVILHHFSRVPDGVASFGQGCEGEPLPRARDLSRAIELVRAHTARGTINLNTNGSLPDRIPDLRAAGLDSIRISLNSPTERYYNRYVRSSSFSFSDMRRSVETALGCGLFVSLNLFFLPGFTDMESEVDSLFAFLRDHPVHMIQTRNLNIDPDLYWAAIGVEETNAIGIRTLCATLRERHPAIRLGYYNPPREKFGFSN